MTSAIVVKTIKANKINSAIFMDEFRRGMDATAKEMLGEFEKTTRTWQHDVEFDALTDMTGGNIAVLVGTDDEIYNYVDQGTRPHRIAAKNAPALAFVWGGKGSYRSATVPRWIGSRNASVSGSLHRPKAVNHPGFEGREFSITIQKWEKSRYKRRMEQHLKNAVQRSGQEMR